MRVNTNQVTATIQTEATGGYVQAGTGAIWVTNPGTSGTSNGTLSRIDPTTNAVVATIGLGDMPLEIALSGANVWVAMQGEATVVRVSATSNLILGRIHVADTVYAVAASDHAVWAVHSPGPANADTPPPSGSVTRINY